MFTLKEILLIFFTILITTVVNNKHQMECKTKSIPPKIHTLSIESKEILDKQPKYEKLKNKVLELSKNYYDDTLKFYCDNDIWPNIQNIINENFDNIYRNQNQYFQQLANYYYEYSDNLEEVFNFNDILTNEQKQYILFLSSQQTIKRIRDLNLPFQKSSSYNNIRNILFPDSNDPNSDSNSEDEIPIEE